jgi:hypothetical protein
VFDPTSQNMHGMKIINMMQSINWTPKREEENGNKKMRV